MIRLAKTYARHVIDHVVPLQQLRLAHPDATLEPGVKFTGDVTRVRLGGLVHVAGPTVLAVTDGGGHTGARLEIGEGTYVGEFNNIRCAGAPIVIGSHCLVSQHITIVGTNHGIEPGSHVVDQPWTGDGVVVGDGVWIGAGAVILPGARIGDGAVIAANSVVRGEVPAGAVIAGAPARVLKTR